MKSVGEQPMLAFKITGEVAVYHSPKGSQIRVWPMGFIFFKERVKPLKYPSEHPVC